MRPFFPYFGSKWNLARSYVPPPHSPVIEPFAGSAAYSLYFNARKVTLIDKNEKLVAVWQYLVKATEREIRSLPVELFEHVDDLDVCQEARWLIGFWINRGTASPRNKLSVWAKENWGGATCKTWGPPVKSRIISQLDGIRDWRIVLGDYSLAPDIRATWFVDPPYVKAGVAYEKQVESLANLGSWCRARRGFVIVCENRGAQWLPFNVLRNGRGSFGTHRSGVSKEVVWVQHTL